MAEKQMQAGIALLAVVGAIALGLYSPKEYSQVATGVLSTAVGGYWGYSQGRQGADNGNI